MDISFGVFLLLLTLAGSFNSGFSEGVSYDGDQVWRYYSGSSSESSSVLELIEGLGLDVWSANPNRIDFRVPRSFATDIAELWTSNDIQFDIMIDDVGRLIDAEKEQIELRRESKADFTFDQYHPLSEIFAYLDEVAASSELVSQEVIGTTYEGREIRMLRIRSPDSTDAKPIVWIDCGIHAREWITPATCLWGLDQIISNYGVDQVVTDFINDNDIWMVPVLNVDGYDYTWSDDRLWRKNRMDYNISTGCVGTDLNRNYDDGHWGGIGSSDSNCIDIYHGPSPFSEFETTAVRSMVLGILSSRTIKSFLSIHSYGQYWLYAYGWTNDLPSDSDEMHRVSQVGVDAIASVNGTIFTNGPHFATIYPATGVSVDWGYSLGIVHTYIIELRDQGNYGFILPEDQILPTATETWTGIVAAINAI